MTSTETTVRCRFTVRVEMQSDWHIGTGGGRHGSIDRLVDRDADDLPFIPAKTMTGIWRNACEQLAAALDHGNPRQPWAGWVEHLFGSQPALAKRAILEAPTPAALSVRPARLPNELCEHLKGAGQGRESLRAALTLVKPGVAIDGVSGRARTDHLRFEEVARAGAILQAEGEVQLTGTADQRDAAFALLIASAGLIERLGGKRRRGTGRCAWQLALADAGSVGAIIDLASALQWLEGNHGKSIETPRSGAATWEAKAHRTAVEPNGEWWSVPLRILLRGPVACARATLGNLVETFDYVPGTALLPIVAGMLRRSGLDAEAAIAQGALRVLPATLEVDGRRGLPVPLALRASGRQRTGGTDPIEVVNHFAGEESGDRKAKAPDRCYLDPHWPTVEGGASALPAMARVATVVRTHNSVEDAVQRPTEVTGGVYSYEAIAAQQALRSEIRLKRALLDALSSGSPTWWSDLAQGEHRLGRSTKDDYGRITIEAEAPRRSADTAVAGGRNGEDGVRLSVWFISDALLRDGCLRPAANVEAVRRTLETALGTTLVLQPASPESGAGLAELRVRRIESWQRRWGLARPTLIAIAGGSCAVFRAAGPIDPIRLAQVEADGIGERRSEGYGCVVFNHPLLAAPLSGLHWRHLPNGAAGSPSDTTPPPIDSANPVFGFAREIETAAWRSVILEAALSIAADASRRRKVFGWLIDQEPCESRPTMSQLANLRHLVAGLESPEPGVQSACLNALRSTDANENASIAAKWSAEARDRVHVLFCSKDAIWRRLAIDDRLPPPVTRQSDRMKAELRGEALRVLVETCVRAHKRDIERCYASKQAGVLAKAV